MILHCFKLKPLLLLFFSLLTFLSFAQLPADLPWAGEDCQGENILLQSGIIGVTCGTSTDTPAGQRWTFGLINIDGALPGSGRIDASATQAMYHHPSWDVDELGNVFGIAINQTNGCVFTTASSNYGSAFSSYYGNTPSITQYGNIGGGANSIAAAGTVYKIDAVTGQATVFAQLPQQSTTFQHYDCELGTAGPNRTSGVGLGNIVYDEVHDQYFVSNIEDGRIYRLSNTGAILDSYDPLTYDDGAAGITDLEDLAYGLAITDDGSRLFFGTIAAPSAGINTPGVSTVPIYAIDILPNGGFSGTIDNTVLPAGVPNNYVGTETLQIAIPVGGTQNGNQQNVTFADNSTFQVSDLHFDANGNLLVGVRISCNDSFHGSYNHWGETNIVMPDASGIYNMLGGEYDLSAFQDAGPDDNYGGVASWELQDGSGDIQYLASSADILEEIGPHGIAIFDSNATAGTPQTNPNATPAVSPLAAISYGLNVNGDPKGVGGDVEVFNVCCLVTCTVIVSQIAECAVANGSITATGEGAKNGNYLYSLDGFATAGQSSGTFSGLAAGSYTVTVRDAEAIACENTCEIELTEDNTPKCIEDFGAFTIIKNEP